jgi:hypothetical protein
MRSQPKPPGRGSRLLRAILPLLVLAGLAGCTVAPTPFQPLGAEGGYDETRLQENVWRVSFRANAYTSESEVVDYLFLRSAELTRQSGYPYFAIERGFGQTNYGYRSTSPSLGLGLGYSRGFPDPFWGMGFAAPPPPEYEPYPASRVGIFVIRMLTAEEAKKTPSAYEVDYLLKSLGPKEVPPAQGKP